MDETKHPCPLCGLDEPGQTSPCNWNTPPDREAELYFKMRGCLKHSKKNGDQPEGQPPRFTGSGR